MRAPCAARPATAAKKAAKPAATRPAGRTVKDEVKESAVIDESTVAEAPVDAPAEALAALAAANTGGVVGAAGTSFQSLRALTVDFAKLDGSLISGVDRDPQTNRLLESILGYCRETGAGLIAEFIETEAEEALVRRLGVRLGQGRRYGMGRGDWVEAYREALG